MKTTRNGLADKMRAYKAGGIRTGTTKFLRAVAAADYETLP
ncbi:hypothetical protein [Cardiobacterium hominis]